METRFLETFLLVVETGAIAAAARRLNISSPAVSQRIRALEDELGFPLLMRNGRTVRPTPAGAAIVERARDCIGLLQEMRLAPALTEAAGELRIGSIATAITGICPSRCRCYR